MRNRLKICLLIIILIVQFNSLAQGDQTVNDDNMIIPDPSMQDQFNRIASIENKEKALSEVSNLQTAGNADIEHSIQQLIYFRVNTKKMYNSKKNTSLEMGKAMNFSSIMLSKFLVVNKDSGKLDSASTSHVIAAVVPYLETKDLELKKQLRWLLEGIDFQELSFGNYGLYKADYTQYELVIKDKKDAPPQSLIQYMYEISPGDALLALTRVYIKESEARNLIIQAEKLISNDFRKRYFDPVENRSKIGAEAKKALDDLSKYDQWWIRLYVAEIIGREPALRSPEILERLKKDTNPLVRETLNSFQKDKE